MKIIRPETVSFIATITGEDVRERIAISATITEEDVRARIAMEVIEFLHQIRALGETDEALCGVEWAVRRRDDRKGGYTITVTGPAPVRLALPRGTDV